MTAEPKRQLVEEYWPFLLGDLVHPHTLGRSFYMRPSRRPQIADKVYMDNAGFWRDVLDERIGAERNVTLKGFNVFEWVPRNPGLFHTSNAKYARDEAENHVRQIETQIFDEYLVTDGAPPDGATAFRAVTSSDGTVPRTLIYTPQGKVSMLMGGVGCVRFKPLQLKAGGTAWLMSATSSTAPDEGIPLLMGNDDYLDLVEGLQDAGAVCCDVFGRTRFVAEEFRDLFSIQNGIPRLYVEVSAVRLQRVIEEPGQVSVAASFLSDFEGAARIYASYVTFDPGRPGARLGAAQWLKEEYVERLYKGSLLTDFDQRAPMFANSLFTLDQVLTSPDLAAKVAKLRHLYGSFDWAQLDRFSYVEHQGDLIVTNNTITVSNSTNVVIQSTLNNAQLTAGSLPAGDDSQRKELQSLLQQLQDALPRTSFDKAEQAEDLAAQAKEMVDEAAKAQPNKSRLQRVGEGLKKTADFLKDTVPSTVTIAGQIVSLIGKIHGIAL
jgi:ElaB/YqjD/DUF883 family membrane-anchored ribosome-binding protein